jgi:hypothetical protein
LESLGTHERGRLHQASETDPHLFRQFIHWEDEKECGVDM